MKPEKTILILGAGTGGVVVANRLRKELPDSYRIVIVDKNKDHLFEPSLLWLMIGDRDPKKITRPIERLKRKGIDVIHGNIDEINPSNKSVKVNGNTIEGDFMVVALGASYAPESIPGLQESGHNAYTIDGATKIRDNLELFKGGRIVILTSAPLYKCPAAPYEMAMLIEYHCRRLSIREKTEINLYAAEPGPMGTAGPDVSKQVRLMVEGKRIAYHPSHQIVSANPQSKIITFTNGLNAGFDLLIYTPPHCAPDVVKSAGLLSESGWISVNRDTLETKFDGIFAIGDVTSIPLKIGKPLPKAGVFVHGQAEVVAKNIITKLRSSGPPASYDGYGKCFIETGDGKAGVGFGNFYAEPAPDVTVKAPSIFWHISKIMFEKFWFYKWF